MNEITFKILGQTVVYELCNKSEVLSFAGVNLVNQWGDVGAWGDDYHRAVRSLHGAAKIAAENKYLRSRAESLLARELLSIPSLYETINHAA